MRVVVGAGGTAGHVFPALAAAERLRAGWGAEVTFVGREQGLEARLVPEAGFPLVTVQSLPFVRKLSAGMLRAPLAALGAARRSRGVVRGADVVLGMGGYVSVPVALAARSERVPLVVHEQNAAPGLANRVAARWARAAAVSFAEAARRLPRSVLTGNPVRPEVARIRRDRPALRREAMEALGLRDDRRTVVVFGGSQGALRLNRAAVEAVRLLAERRDAQVLLLTGTAHHPEISAALPRGAPIRAVAFLDRMELAYAAADVVVSRAGATTVAELTVAGLPAILVPYPYATGRHQEANARAVERAGAAVVVADGDVTARSLAEHVGRLLDDDPRRTAMAGAAEAFGRPEAAEDLARLAAEVAGGRLG
ncbi:MAG TPA: undecaprenyldiphospho-muramoylpentapeptide beta-N-acetylglucosaminyltransferase [Actinomycetota bacterium]|nr:undecaprenyldiphospho-muramoylpentapeptide beta-N-acetylglucosaminyltransferase [Actinomycetota bacterium]